MAVCPRRAALAPMVAVAVALAASVVRLLVLHMLSQRMALRLLLAAVVGEWVVAAVAAVAHMWTAGTAVVVVHPIRLQLPHTHLCLRLHL